LARGWESKSVESQQEESLREPNHRGLNLSPEERARLRKEIGSILASKLELFLPWPIHSQPSLLPAAMICG